MVTYQRMAWTAGVLCMAVCLGCSTKPASETADVSKTVAKTDANTTSVAMDEKPKAAGEGKMKPKDVQAASGKDAKKSSVKASVKISPPVMPKVYLTAEIAASCVVKVGDTMPGEKLATLDGKSYALNELYDNRKLVVLCFWNAATPRAKSAAEETLEFLLKEIAEPYSPKGGPVRIIGVNVGDAVDVVKQIPLSSGGGYIFNDVGGEMHLPGDAQKATESRSNPPGVVALPCLLDPKGEFYAKVAKDRRMPRIYLLDIQGKILWFDVEFSRATRENLLQAIQSVVGK
jgi:hypothetical protein